MTLKPKPSHGGARSHGRADQRQVSLMHVFRASAENGDSQKELLKNTSDDRALSLRRKQHRDGTDEATLRRHLSIDLANLMNTIRLDATSSLDDAEYVKKSIVNFGFSDMSSMSKSDNTNSKIIESIRRALITYEPRLIPESIEITVNGDHQTIDQRLSFEITAEMVANPIDIPLNFMAEVDLGAGKMKMTRLQVQT
jgi:type VI secretion system protein ImpF